MAYKVSFTWFQAAEKLGGFTENFWNAAGSLQGAYVDALNLLLPLTALHGRQTVIQTIRISNVTNQRDVLNFPQIISIPAPLGDGLDSDYFNTAALLRLTSSGTVSYQTRQWIRSMPDNVVDRGGRLQYTPAFIAASGALIALLNTTSGFNSNWRMRVLDKSLQKKRITNITLQGVVTCPAHGFPDQSLVRISGAKGLTGINRVWIISLIDVNTFQLANIAGAGGVLLSNAKPTARLQSPIFVPITSAIFIRATSHKTGRPSGQLGGKKRKPA